jgi:hypothetical protein
MKHYMLFIREDLDAVKRMTEEQIQEDIRIMTKWVEDLSRSGNFVQGEPLEPEVRISRKDDIISDGPFIETKEAVSGYMIIQAENLDQAARIAQGCPALGANVESIEVRPVMKY